MKTNKWLFLFISLLQINILFAFKDTLKWSIGYGTLYGGGLGVKYEPFSFCKKRITLHVGISAGFLPLMAHESIIDKNGFLNVYQNFDKRIVFGEGIEKIWRERYIIPFSINLSYPINKHFDFMFGYGTLSRIYVLERIRNGFFNYLHAVEIYKLSAFNISFLYKHKKYFTSVTYSQFFTALRYFDGSYFNEEGVPTIKFRKGQSTLTLSLGYYFK